MSKSKINLNKESFDGVYVRHWKRQWVHYGDVSKEDKGAWALKLIKWVQTDVRVCSTPARNPHICPVLDLSLVPGARLNTGTAAGAAAAAAAAAAEIEAPAAVLQRAPGAPAPIAAASGQQVQHIDLQQQQQQLAGFANTSGFAGAPGQSAAAAAAAALAAPTATGDLQLGRATSLNALSVDGKSVSQTDAAAAAAGGSGLNPYVLPSPSVGTEGAFAYSHPSAGQLQTTGSDFAVYAAGLPSSGGAASGYAAGTDSDALGRLPHASGPAASEYTDSMDVDGSQQQRSQRAGTSLTIGSMDTGADLEDIDSDEAAAAGEEGDEEEEYEEAEGEGDDVMDDEEGDEGDEGVEEEGYAEEEDGLEDEEDDMP